MSVKNLLKKKYAEVIDIEYIDVTDTRLNDFAQIKQFVEDSKTPLPIVAFDGVPTWAGVVSFPHIVQELARRGFDQK